MIRKLWRDERGQVLIMLGIALPVMFGFVGLAIEGSRYMMLHSQLQDLADAAALAGAKQLTGASGSITAARSAVNDTYAFKNYPWLSNDQSSSTAAQIAAADVHVCEDIANSPCTDTTDDTKARYVQVTTIARGTIPAFLTAVGAGAQTARATATAESFTVACNVQPLMLCNPNEPNDFNPAVGSIFGFTEAGSTQGFSPGVFSLLDPPGQTHSSAPDIKINLSAVAPAFCYINNVSPRTGEVASTVAQAINVRFDMQPNNPKNLDVTPAINVIKGNTKNLCLSTTNNNITTSAEMPLNLNTTSIGGTAQGGTFDTANANAYWSYHHGGNWPTVNGVPITRYAAYQGENNGTYPFLAGTELPAKQCTSTAAVADRRIVSVAVVNCNTENVTGNSVPSMASAKYADFFIIRPVDTTGPGNGVIWTEFVRIFTPSSDKSKLKQIVQLVRDQ